MAGSKGGKKRPHGGKQRRRCGRKQILLAAIEHPLRRRILLLMADGRQASPRQMADALQAPLSSVVYHVRSLAECRALKPAPEGQAGGAAQHLYRRAEMPDWMQAMLEQDEEQSP